jgi:Ca2+-binding RTX toxin-like protein
MWMFLALLGAVAAAGVADHMVQAAQDEDTLDDPPPEDMGQGQDGNGDLLTLDAGPSNPEVMPDSWLPPPHESGVGEGPGLSRLTPLPEHDYNPNDRSDEDGFISSDKPLPPPSDDYIVADADGTPVLGGAGNDTLVGLGADDHLDGGDGNDSLIGGAGNDTLIGGAGQDTLAGGDGDDSLMGGAGAGLLLGEDGNDVLIGGAEDDTLIGGSGDDTLIGGYGDDVLVAGEGRDLLMGGGGNDTLIGYTPDADGRDIDGGDFLNGGAGDDLIILGSGDVASGGSGADDFVLGPWIDPGDPAVISDFDDEDGLVIAYDGSGPEPVIGLAYDDEAGGVVLRVNGAVMAIMQGVDTLDPDAVTLLPLTR